MFRKLIEPCGLHCIRMNDIGVTVGEQEILKNINLHIHCGNLAAVIGKNGAGKSTLIKAILGDIRIREPSSFPFMRREWLSPEKIWS